MPASSSEGVKKHHSCLGSYVKTKCARFMLVRSGTGDPKHITIRLDNNERLVVLLAAQ